MNICFVTDQFTDYVSGVEQSLFNQMDLLEDAGHTVFLIRPHQAHQPVLSNELTITPRITLRIGGAVLPVVRRTPVSMRRMRQFMIDNKIEIIHSQGQGPISYMALLTARDLAIPFVDTLHSFFLRAKESFVTWMLRPITVRLVSLIAGYKVTPLPGSDSITNRASLGAILTFLKKVDVVISPSRHQKDALERAGLTVPIECIPNPLSRNSQKPQSDVANNSPLHVVWIGRMAAEKRLPMFVDAIAIALDQRPGKLKVTMVGDGVDRRVSEQRTIGLPGVSFVGVKRHDEILEILDSAHILALTSYHFDNQPMVVTEAVSRYRGVLYCDERLTPEIGAAGVLTDGCDAAAIAKTIIDLIDHPEKAVKLSHACQRQVEQFLPNYYVGRILAVYNAARERIL